MYDFADRFDGVTGSAIRKIFSLLTDPEMISFAGGNPSPELFPGDALRAISNELIKNDSAWVLQYGDTKGVPAFLSLLRERNHNIMKPSDDIIISSGSTQGIEMFTRAILNEGDRMLVESPTFLGAIQTFKLARANIKAVDLAEDGVDLHSFEAAVKRFRPKFFYIIPTFQNPSGITTSQQKRKKIYEICAANGVLILEDDPYSELRYSGEPLESIKSYDDRGIVCKLSSFSKTISPGLRVGYAIAHADIIAKFNLLKQVQDVHTSNLTQSMVMGFLESGQYEKHVAYLCERYKEQRDCMLDVIDKYFPEGVKYTHPDGGLFIWVTLPDGMDAQALFHRCVEQKIAFVPGEPFFADGGHSNTLRMNFSMPCIEDIRTGVERMGRIIREYD